MESNDRYKNVNWYARRVRAMDWHEFLWRVRQAAISSSPGFLQRIPSGQLCDKFDAGGWDEALYEFRSGTNRPVLLNQQKAKLIKSECPDIARELIESANSVIRGQFSFFGYPKVTISRKLDWHFDAISGVRWPAISSHKINHRFNRADVKWIWELNRLQHLPWLAQAWLFSGDCVYASAAFEHIDSWIEQNEAGKGIAWRGSFEAGIRAISIAVALQGLSNSPQLTVCRYKKIVELLAYCAGRCWRERSRYSSANNHLIGEMAGLAVVAIMFPELRCSAIWERRALHALSEEATRQILADGGGAEQAIGYHLFTAELLNLVAWFCARRDATAPREISEALARSSEFLRWAVGVGDPDPRYGDNDEGFALRLGTEAVRSVQTHLGIVDASGFGGPVSGVGRQSLDSLWFSRSLESRRDQPVRTSLQTAAVNHSKSLSFHAPDSGLVVFRRGSQTITMDVGPLGYLKTAAHGHADALSITLSQDGHYAIGDPGTGSYYGHPDWRSRMRGTRAHATVSVDDQDQSVIGGPFLWSRRSQTRVHRVSIEDGIVDAEHDGYTRLQGRVVHRRWLVANPQDHVVLVVDMLNGRGSHLVRSSWPLHPTLEMRRIDGGYLAVRDGYPSLRLLHAATSSFTSEHVRGDTALNLGWWSDRLESRKPAWWLGLLSNTELPMAIATLMITNDCDPWVSRLKIRFKDRGIEVSWVENKSARSVLIHHTEPGSVVFQPGVSAHQS